MAEVVGGIVTVEIEIQGTSPLLIHRFAEAAELSKSTRKTVLKERDPRTEAESHAYIREDGSFYFAGTSIPGCLKVVGTNYKQKSSRKSLKYLIGPAVRMVRDDITINNGNGKPAKDFEVDSRPVTIPATKGRIMRHRPRWNQWSAKFEVAINTGLIEEDMVHTLLNDAGQQAGIGDFRPTCGGPFGCFLVKSWKRTGKEEEVKAA